MHKFHRGERVDWCSLILSKLIEYINEFKWKENEKGLLEPKHAVGYGLRLMFLFKELGVELEGNKVRKNIISQVVAATASSRPRTKKKSVAESASSVPGTKKDGVAESASSVPRTKKRRTPFDRPRTKMCGVELKRKVRSEPEGEENEEIASVQREKRTKLSHDRTKEKPSEVQIPDESEKSSESDKSSESHSSDRSEMAEMPSPRVNSPKVNSPVTAESAEEEAESPVQENSPEKAKSPEKENSTAPEPNSTEESIPVEDPTLSENPSHPEPNSTEESIPIEKDNEEKKDENDDKDKDDDKSEKPTEEDIPVVELSSDEEQPEEIRRKRKKYLSRACRQLLLEAHILKVPNKVILDELEDASIFRQWQLFRMRPIAEMYGIIQADGLEVQEEIERQAIAYSSEFPPERTADLLTKKYFDKLVEAKLDKLVTLFAKLQAKRMQDRQIWMDKQDRNDKGDESTSKTDKPDENHVPESTVEKPVVVHEGSTEDQEKPVEVQEGSIEEKGEDTVEVQEGSTVEPEKSTEVQEGSVDLETIPQIVPSVSPDELTNPVETQGTVEKSSPTIDEGPSEIVVIEQDKEHTLKKGKKRSKAVLIAKRLKSPKFVKRRKVSCATVTTLDESALDLIRRIEERQISMNDKLEKEQRELRTMMEKLTSTQLDQKPEVQSKLSDISAEQKNVFSMVNTLKDVQKEAIKDMSEFKSETRDTLRLILESNREIKEHNTLNFENQLSQLSAFQQLAENQVGGNNKQQKGQSSEFDFEDYEEEELMSSEGLARSLALSDMTFESGMINSENAKEVFEAKILHKGFPPSWNADEVPKKDLWVKFLKELKNCRDIDEKAKALLIKMRYYLCTAMKQVELNKRVVSDHRCAEWYKDAGMERKECDAMYIWLAGNFGLQPEVGRKVLWFYFRLCEEDWKRCNPTKVIITEASDEARVDMVQF